MAYLASTKDEVVDADKFKDIDVANIYDKLGDEYEKYILEDEGRLKCLEWAVSEVSQFKSNEDRPYTIDVGCASGIPAVQHFAKAGHEVVGVDISPGQIELGNKNVVKAYPNASFVEADLMKWTPPEERRGKVDCVCSFYVVPHLPVGEYKQLIQNSAGWLRPGGLFVLGAVKGVNGKVNWWGNDIVATSMSLDALKEVIEGVGLRIEKMWEEDWVSTSGNDSHPKTKKTNQFLLAKKV